MTQLVREVGFTNFNFGLSSAMAWIYFVAVSLILAIAMWIISRRVFYYD
jgi:ABC-type sugar transport system permease subunit